MTKNEALQLAATILSGNNYVSGLKYNHSLAEHLFDLAEQILAENEKRSPKKATHQSELNIY